MIYRYLLVVFVTALTLVACKKDKYLSGELSEVLPAGKNCTVYDQTSYAFSKKIKGLNTDQNLDFFVGNSFFNQMTISPIMK